MPLLIGGATTSRVHTAVKIEPHYSRAGGARADASRAVGVAGALLSRTQRDAFVARRARPTTPARPRAASRRGARAAPDAGAGARATRPDRLDACPCRGPRSLGARDDRGVDRASSCRCIDWTPFFQTWELAGAYPGDPRRPAVGERRAACSTTRRRCSRGSIARALAARRAASSASGRPTRRRPTTSSVYADERPHDRARPRSTRSASRWRSRRAARTCARGLRRAARSGVARLRRGRSRSRRHRRRRRPRHVRGRARRLQRDHAEGARRPARRGVRRGLHERVRRELWGYAPRRAALDTRDSSPRSTRASGRRRAIRPAPTTPRRRRCSRCSTRGRARASR